MKNKNDTDITQKDKTEIKTSPSTLHPFYNKTFVFTGTLQAMIRSKAYRYVLKGGGHCKNSITPSVNYLVMGVQRLSAGKDGKSNKLKKAEKLLSGGGKIELITEDEFLRMLSYIKSDLSMT